MRNFKYGLLITLALLTFQSTGYGFQGSAGEEVKRAPGSTKEPGKPGKAGPKKPPSLSARPVSTGGVPGAPPAPALAEVVINTSLADCIIMLDGDTKGRTNGSGVLKLTAVRPGSHIVTVRRNGYRDEQRNVELYGGRSDTISFTLSRILSVPELVTNAEEAYRNARYAEVLASCREALAAQPDNPRANLLFGQASYMTGQVDSATALWKALSLGEVVTLPIKHHHGGVKSLITGKLDDLCSGNLVLRKGLIEFQSKEKSDENFSVQISKLVEVKNEIRKGGRLSLKVKLPKGNKETDKTYNFHALAALVVRPNVICMDPSCGITVDTLYTLLQKLKQ
jgi:hypothetical protein